MTMEELGGHNSSGDLWMLLDGKGESCWCAACRIRVGTS